MSFNEFMKVVKSITAPPDDFFNRCIKDIITGDYFLPSFSRNVFFPSSSNAGFDYNTAFVENGGAIFLVNNQKLREHAICTIALRVKYLCYIISNSSSTNGFDRTINEIDKGVIDDWFDANSNLVGQAQFLLYMLQPDKLQRYFQDASTWSVRIAAKIGTDNFFKKLLDECKIVGSNLPAKVLLLILKSLDHAGHNFTKVLNVWNQNDQWDLIKDYDSYPWLDGAKDAVFLNSDINNIVNQAVTDACKFTLKRTGPSSIIVVPNAKVQDWVDADLGPKKYGLRSNYEGPKEREIHGLFDDFINVIKSIKAPPDDFFIRCIEDILLGDPFDDDNEGCFSPPSDRGKGKSTFFDDYVVGSFTIGIFDDHLNAIFLTNNLEDQGRQLTKHQKSIKELNVKYLCLVMSKSKATNGFDKTINPIDIGVINDWFDTNSNRIGQVQFLNYVTQHQMLERYFQDASFCAPVIATKIGTDDFLTGFLVECQISGSNLPAMVLLLVLKSLDRVGDSFTKVLNVWKQNEQWDLIKDYDSYPWLDGVKGTIGLNSDIYNTINQAVAEACKNNIIPLPLKDIGVWVNSPTKVITPSAKVQNWVNAEDGPKAYGLRSNDAGPQNTFG